MDHKRKGSKKSILKQELKCNCNISKRDAAKIDLRNL